MSAVQQAVCLDLGVIRSVSLSPCSAAVLRHCAHIPHAGCPHRTIDGDCTGHRVIAGNVAGSLDLTLDVTAPRIVTPLISCRMKHKPSLHLLNQSLSLWRKA